MFKKRLGIAALLVASLWVLSGCGEYEKLLKSRDSERKFEVAMELYEEGNFVKASTLFDQIANYYRGFTKADTVKFYQAKSYYGQRDYMMAGYFFNELATVYASSPFLEESEFMSAYCYYKQSPRPELDQTNTYKTIQAMQIFMVRYPNSERVVQAQAIITEMGDKLVEKSFISARLYYDLGYYKSAILALRNSLIEYPDTRHREELMFLILKSSYLLADNSVPSRQPERYQATVDEYYSFIGEFPEGDHTREANRMYEASDKYLKKNTNKES